MSTRWRALTAASAAICMSVVLGTQPVSAAPGDLDQTFSQDGWRVIDFGGDSEWARAVVVQPDGKIVVAGITNAAAQGNNDFALARLTPKGKPDTTFGSDGLVRTGFVGGAHPSNDDALDIALAPGGKIVAVGFSSNAIAVARYRPNGTLDTTFSTDGKLRFTYAGRSSDAGERVAVLPDGRILLAVQTKSVGSKQQVGLVRLTVDGTLDDTFSGDGKRIVPLGTAPDLPAWIGDMVVTDDGTATVVGTQDSVHAMRITPAGGIDSTFGDDDGRYTAALAHAYAWAATVDAQDRVVVAAIKDTASDDDVLFRSQPSGIGNDGGFGSGGIAMVCPDHGCVQNAVTTVGSKILTVGIRLARGTAGYIRRFLGDGQPDPDWHAQTIAKSKYSDVAVVGGRAVVVGVMKDGLDFFVARYLMQ